MHREDCLLKPYNINGEESSFILLDDSFRYVKWRIVSIIYKINAKWRLCNSSEVFIPNIACYIMIYKGKYVFYYFVDLAQSASKYI